MKIKTCSNSISFFTPGSENELTCANEMSKKPSDARHSASQKSILKQPSTTKRQFAEGKGENCPNFNKSVSVAGKTDLDAENRDSNESDTGNLITVSTAVYFDDVPKPQSSNVTSTYYNKDFLPKSQSEKEVDIVKRAKKDATVCTENFCHESQLK